MTSWDGIMKDIDRTLNQLEPELSTDFVTEDELDKMISELPEPEVSEFDEVLSNVPEPLEEISMEEIDKFLSDV